MIEPLYDKFKYFLSLTWPIVFVTLIILISFRVSYLYQSHKKVVIYKEILLFFFAFYLLCLFQIVASTDPLTPDGSNFIPFQEITRYKLFSKLFIRNIIGNILIFLPYGYFIGRYFTHKSKMLSIFLVLLASVSIEFTQLYIGRVFDVDDIILNVIGGTIGYLIYLSFEKIYSMLPKVFKSETFLNIIFIIMLILFIIFILFLLI